MILPSPALLSTAVASVRQRASPATPGLWKFPDGARTDFSQTFYAGQFVNISWSGGFNTSYSDLWITAWDYDENNSFAQLLTSRSSRRPIPLRRREAANREVEMVDLTVDGSYLWTVDIPTPQLAASPKFLLKFKPFTNNYQFDTAAKSLNSPGFLVARDSSSPPSKTPTKPDPSAGDQEPQPTTDSAPLTPGSLPSPDGVEEEPDGLSVPGQVGVAVGTVAGVMALGALAWIVARRYRNRRRRRGPSWPRPGLTVQTNLVAGLPLHSSTSSYYSSPGSGDSPTSVMSPYGAGDMTPGFWYGRSSPVELEAESVRWA